MSQEKIERWNEVDGNLDNGEKLQAFLDSTTDAYAILQLRRTDETVYERFESYEALKRQGKEPNIDHYDVVYVAPLSSYTDQTAMLEGLYTKFNVERPEDFRGHSLSVSDIVALKTDAGLLVGIGLAVYAVLFLFVLFQEIGEHIKENLRDFIFS